MTRLIHRSEATPAKSSRRKLTPHRSNVRGFTSLELLVVLVTLMVLISIFLPALIRSKEKDIRVTCINNEKRLYASLQMYCNDNGDLLPRLDSFGSWPWDVPDTVTTPMLGSGCTQKTFYCPSTAPKFTDQVNWAAPNSLWNYGNPNYHITAYVFVIDGNSSRLDPRYQNRTILSEVQTNLIGVIAADIPATRELITDVMISASANLPAAGSDNFISIAGGFTQNGITYPHLSAHLGKGQVPAGGNIAFKDGHVQWRKFDASQPNPNLNPTKVRTAPGVTPYFWW